MPLESKAQNRWAHWQANQGGPKAGVAREFIQATKSAGTNIKRLPERVKRPTKPKQPKPARPFGSMAPTQAGHYDGDMPE